MILLRGTPPTVQALVAGSVYVGGATPDAVMEVTERGVDLVMVVGVINGLSHAIMGGKTINAMRIYAERRLAARV